MKKKIEELEYRMYGLVPYNLSGIQAGIQYGHAVQEYNNIFLDNTNVNLDEIKAFDKWRLEDKTFIICNGGTTNENPEDKFYGTLQQMRDKLVENDILFAEFREPDLNNTLTAVVFLVDERVFDRVNYPDFQSPMSPSQAYNEDSYYEWVEFIGGEKNVFLREFTDKSVMRLANN